MTSADSIDPMNGSQRTVNPTALTVIAGLTYSEPCQVFNRWLLPAYQTAFRWTGDLSDAEDATTWVFKKTVGFVRLPELVSVVDRRVAAAMLDAASLHWSNRYGVAWFRCSEIYEREAAVSAGPALNLEALCDGLSAEMRLLIVLRFLRGRSLSAISTQLGIPPAAAKVHLYEALSRVAARIGLDASPCNPTQVDEVAAFVDDLVGKRRPLRFEVAPQAWAALLAATHIQAAVAGNNLPRARFVRSLEGTFSAGHARRHVTHLRIWSA
ncbi:MAG: hypothetical protein QOG08_327 [Chloroflexota bacterium]|nr:hypothetical protein [Chloroflexota bacterium]